MFASLVSSQGKAERTTSSKVRPNVKPTTESGVELSGIEVNPRSKPRVKLFLFDVCQSDVVGTCGIVDGNRSSAVGTRFLVRPPCDPMHDYCGKWRWQRIYCNSFFHAASDFLQHPSFKAAVATSLICSRTSSLGDLFLPTDLLPPVYPRPP